ncbi:MAG TPA: AAA family ATPase [Solirubrobacteraceae bacterium]|nr:AAA family ATPase [Solirubrobacteraceae bacterium]
MPGALTAGLDKINAVAAEGGLDAAASEELALDLDAGEPVMVPDMIDADGQIRCKAIYPPKLHGSPVHEVAGQLLDMQSPERSRFLKLTGPPGTGKSRIGRLLAYHLWTSRGRAVEVRHGRPFYGFVEMQPGPSSDEFFFRYDYVPAESGGDVRLVDSLFVQAMRHGWIVMLDEVNTARDVALLSINSTLDGRVALHLPATGETVIAQPGFAVLLSYNAGLLGATDLPDAWHSRFPATIEVTSNWAALVKLGAPEQLIRAAMALDGRRFAGDDGLGWTPQFRDIEGLADMIDRCGERTAIALFVSNLAERVTAGQIQPAELAATMRMLDEAGYAHLKVRATSRIANVDGYPRATTR